MGDTKEIHGRQTKSWSSEVKVTQACPTLCDPTYWSLPDSSVRGILQGRILDSLEKTLMLKDWRQEEKGTTEDEMVGWHPWLDGHECEKALEIVDGQGNLTCCSPWGCNESDMTERMNWTELRILKRVAVPFPKGSSQPRNQAHVSHIAGGFFTIWATREAQGWKLSTHNQIHKPFLFKQLD